MPLLTLRIESKNMPPIEAGRKCETLRDIRKLLKDADRSIMGAAKIFPEIAEAKIVRVSVK
jgi:hypothetical protein